MSAVIVDTGPLVALLNRRERRHTWCKEQFALLRRPLLTCEAVLSEACFLVQDIDLGHLRVMELVDRGVVKVAFSLSNESPSISRLMSRYRDVSMSLADACLVRMAEFFVQSKILTLDSDFNVYRKNGRQVIPTMMPS